ncbi:MAG: PHP domain-containing protein [Anaerolineaceae bacterium]|nr:PHP domain-containing protein [Anaerolineaceae bacterium]
MSDLLRTFRAELHVHTVLSPCAEVEMIPPLIVQQALENHIDIIAITDHNATANIRAVQKAAQGSGLVVLPGMELQTVEEVHSLCIFEDTSQAEVFQKIVSQALPPLKNDPEHFGEQFIVDETGDFIRREDQLLILSTEMSLSQAWRFVNEMGGIFIPAHVNRKAFGLLENLGFIPQDIPLPAVEISRHLQSGEAVQKFPQLFGYTLLKGGDAHRLDELAGFNEFTLAEPTFAEIKLAIQSFEGRSIKILD